MYVKQLTLVHYRNYERLELDLPPQAILLQGENAQGKTNLLEAIYYLATTRSPIMGTDRHLIHWGAQAEPQPFARLVADIERASGTRRLEIALVREAANPLEPDSGRLSRRFRINGVDKRAIDLLGQLNVVLFLPQDIDLVCGAPSLRRRYVDVTLCQVDPSYCRHLQRYNHALAQRNSLLRRLRERGDDPAQLVYWDEQLAHWGALVVQRRAQALHALETEAAAVHPELTGGAERLAVQYDASIPLPEVAPGDDPEALPPELAGAFLQALLKARPRDIGAGVSTLGPHRDEVRFLANGVDMGLFGSRGQQRTVALALKLAEVRFMAQQSGEMPVLLLDDVMSELDRSRGRYLLQAIDRAQQVIITAADLSLYPPEFLASVVLWRVRAGAISAGTVPGA
jgi:DNA replication and repair protein RecF